MMISRLLFAGFINFTCYFTCCSSFVISSSKAFKVTRNLLSSHLFLSNDSSSISLEYFDFSSKGGWDNFYEECEQKYEELGFSIEYEWHESLSNKEIIETLLTGEPNDFLIVGCGNSRLPQDLYDEILLRRSSKDESNDLDFSVTCFDYSPKCLDQLKAIHGVEYPNMKYVVGDATKMDEAFGNDEDFDVIVDKGLIDAIICGDGWDTEIEKVLQGSSKVLVSNEKRKGRYVLISYKLTSYLKDFLSENCDLDWDFDISGSLDSISFSIGTKK